ncbi:RNA polymerase subunit sigma-24 [Thioalkalivibrio denitrificans]|uniref:RNA polymerase subunit sigma-24 n=1 Tax=Thioalkalivibrio denitrificans TaxID=108003 RepID=A0A1V3ND39_9GAMM|nr:RNA polymerase sigma factor [Thioalkalivibrio denitrificans]OOG22788.1 RNA polymerase subunit sigma-24 [Thioalkalivibrio denitrificans]
MTGTQVQKTVEAVWRMESPRLVAYLARVTGDLGVAEELAQDAMVAALESWPKTGIPDNPRAWLTAAARYRAIDHLRHRRKAAEKHVQLGHEIDLARASDGGDQGLPDPDDPIGDDLLRLIFTACHPVLSTDARVALTLRLLCGLTTDEIARAYLAAEPTVAQRIVRAKRTLGAARVPFEVPRGPDLEDRLASVLEVIYLVFNEGYAATRGDDWVRPSLCDEALRLGRILAELVPEEAEVHGLVALMELQASRLKARTTESGEPVLLGEQDRGRWDYLLIRRGLAALERALSFGGPLGPYTLQAAIAACHAQAPSTEDTDWQRIAALYDALAQAAPSPVVELNRAVAVGMAFGPAAGLEMVDALCSEPRLQRYHLLPGVRGDLLQRLGRFDEAREAFEAAAALTGNDRERQLLLRRAAECTGAVDPDQGP